MKKMWAWRLWKWPVYLMGAAIITAVGTGGDWFSTAVAISVVLVFFTPFAVLLFLQLSFWSYQWLKHGHPFHESTEPYVYRVVHEKKQKAWCIICKQFSGCHVRKTTRMQSNGKPFLIHVIR